MIEVEGLRKTFPARRRGGQPVDAVRDLTFRVEPGERFACIGPNGAGKSTAIKMLTGILHPTAGTARVLGLVPWRRRRELALRIGTLFGQRSQLWSELSPRQGYDLFGAVYGLAPRTVRERVGALAELLGAAGELDAPVRTLSLGQRMRAELAASLLHEPEVLFLDEPTIGLDLLAKQRFRELLVRVNAERGTTVFLTSHDVADIEHVARRVVVVNHGTLIHDADVAVLRRTLLATKRVEVRFERPPGALDLPGVQAAWRSPTELDLVVDTAARPIRAVLDQLLDRGEVADISVVDPPLEQVIAAIYRTPVGP
jgi:ABC-2 type transport system ATP-binding protein